MVFFSGNDVFYFKFYFYNNDYVIYDQYITDDYFDFYYLYNYLNVNQYKHKYQYEYISNDYIDKHQYKYYTIIYA